MRNKVLNFAFFLRVCPETKIFLRLLDYYQEISFFSAGITINWTEPLISTQEENSGWILLTMKINKQTKKMMGIKWMKWNETRKKGSSSLSLSLALIQLFFEDTIFLFTKMMIMIMIIIYLFIIEYMILNWRCDILGIKQKFPLMMKMIISIVIRNILMEKSMIMDNNRLWWTIQSHQCVFQWNQDYRALWSIFHFISAKEKKLLISFKLLMI